MNKIWRKGFILSLSMILIASLSACGGTLSDTKADASKSSEAAVETSTAPKMSEDMKYKDVMNIAVSQEGATYDVHKTTTLIARQLFS